MRTASTLTEFSNIKEAVCPDCGKQLILHKNVGLRNNKSLLACNDCDNYFPGRTPEEAFQVYLDFLGGKVVDRRRLRWVREVLQHSPEGPEYTRGWVKARHYLNNRGVKTGILVHNASGFWKWLSDLEKRLERGHRID